MKHTKSLAAMATVAALAFGAAWAQTNPTSTSAGGAISSTAGACNTATGNAIAAGNIGGDPKPRANPCGDKPVAVTPVMPATVAVTPPPPAPMPAPAPIVQAPAPAPAPIAAAPVEPPVEAAPVRVARADRN